MKEIIFSEIVLWDNTSENHGKMVHSASNVTLFEFMQMIDSQGFMKNFKQSIEVKY